MAATFLAAQGHSVGGSAIEEDRLDYVRDLMSGEERGNARVLVPNDIVAADRFSESARTATVPVGGIPDEWLILDVGPETADAYSGGHWGFQYRTVEWTHGRFRVGTLFGRYQVTGRGHCPAGRLGYHGHRRRVYGRRGGPFGANGPLQPRFDRWRSHAGFR